MKSIIMGLLLASFVGASSAHEMTPTYPLLKPSHLNGIVKATMFLFNKRADVEYYEVGVFDENLEPVPFVTSYQVFKVNYLGRVTFDVYIRKSDVARAEYVCSRSKIRKGDDVRTAVSSLICSKFKKQILNEKNIDSLRSRPGDIPGLW